MTLSPEHAREWRQFRLLARDSLRQLLDSVVVARDADPMQFAIWASALAMTPPFLVAVRKIIDYPFLLHAPAGVVERVVLADRVFFVLYGMLATTLLVALVWDALSPTRTDQEIVGVLPVWPRTLAAARLTAALAMAMGFAAAINAPAALIYSAASAVHPLVGGFPRVLAGHLIATTLGCAFTFLGLLSARAVVIVCAGERVATRLAVVLQVVTFVLLVEVFFFLPAVLPTLMRGLQQGGTSYSLLPPIWFAALFARIAEGRVVAPGVAELSVTATLVAAIAAVLVTLVPAAWMARRALESRAIPHTGGLTWLARLFARACVSASSVRGLLLFAVASLARNRRHLLVLSAYVGLAIATAIVSLVGENIRGTLTLDRPVAYLLAIPLVAMFFTVFGLRSACSIPTDFDANWPLRLPPPFAANALATTRLLIVGLGVLPPVLVWTLASAHMWGWTTALSLTLLDALAGILLTELALSTWTKVPFATGHEPSADTLKSRWPWFLVALHLYGFRLADLQALSLGSPVRMGVYVAVGLGLLGAAYARNRHRTRGQAVTLDVVPEQLNTLGLSAVLD